MTFLPQVTLLQVTWSRTRWFRNFANSNAFLCLYRNWQKMWFYKRKRLRTVTAHPVKQHFPHSGRGKKLQLQCCPAPPLINPRWLAAGVWGLLQTHMQLTLGECSWWQPRRTLHHLIEMKSVTSWPVFQHLHQHPPPSLGLSLQQQPSGEERQVLKHPQPRSCSVLMSPARSVRGELYSWLELCCRTQLSCRNIFLLILMICSRDSLQ